jgi:hypothetical protein
MPESSSVEIAAIGPGTRRRAITAAIAGNFVEWYDFSVYAYFAVVVAPLFFPSDDPTAGLLATFAVFGIAFVFRPVGALIFGRLGRPRRPALHDGGRRAADVGGDGRDRPAADVRPDRRRRAAPARGRTCSAGPLRRGRVCERHLLPRRERAAGTSRAHRELGVAS